MVSGAVRSAPHRARGLVSDIDFDAGTITVARNRVELGGGPTIVVENEPKTGASRRFIFAVCRWR